MFVSYVFEVVVSLKSSVYVGKFYCENIILLYNDQNKYDFKLSFIFRVCLTQSLRHDFFFVLKHVKLHK